MFTLQANLGLKSDHFAHIRQKHLSSLWQCLKITKFDIFRNTLSFIHALLKCDTDLMAMQAQPGLHFATAIKKAWILRVTQSFLGLISDMQCVHKVANIIG